MTTTDDGSQDGVDDQPDQLDEVDEQDHKKPRKLRKVPRLRRKVSGVELEARFDRWRAGRRDMRAARAPAAGARRARRGLSLAMGVGLLALVLISGVEGQSFESDWAANNERIDALKGDLDAAHALPDDVDIEDRMTALSKVAASDAEKVATLQQRFAKLHRKASTEPDPGNGAPSKAMLAVAEHRKKLAPLFSKESHIVDDEQAYQWTSLPPFDARTQIDPRFSWYTRYDGEKASPASAYAWKVDTVMPDLASQDTEGLSDRAQAVWLCQDAKSEQVLAWASAVYTFDGERGVFDDLEVTVTAAGAQHEQSGKAASKDGKDRNSGRGRGQ